ncbi:hypothetical protein ACFQ07_19855, partial [Actinomadura adrarensis]
PDGGWDGWTTRSVTARGPDRSGCRPWLIERAERPARRVHLWCWNGERWLAKKIPHQEGDAPDADVMVVDGHWLLATDSGLLREWDGSRLPAIPSAWQGYRLSAASTKEIWGVWYDNTIRRMRDGAWETTPVPGVSIRKTSSDGRIWPWINDIAVVSENEVWAVGNTQLGGPEPKMEYYFDDIVLRWDGRRWHRESLGLKGISLKHVIPDGHGGIWVATTGPYMLHHSDGRWTRVPLPTTSGVLMRPRVLDRVDGSDDAWAITEASFDAGVLSLVILRHTGR